MNQPASMVIAVASGKGGVGKSTVAFNLALALKAQGKTVGLLDADLYGPSQASLLGVEKTGEKPEVSDGKLHPLNVHGLQTMSMAYLLEQNSTPVIWRGLIASKTVQQLFADTLWSNLDILVIDCPPGTGDILITLVQKISLQGAVIVTTPEKLSVIDVKKVIEMFKKVQVPLLGLVENMSHYTCPHCHHQDAVFGQGGADQLASAYTLPILARIPLDTSFQEASPSLSEHWVKLGRAVLEAVAQQKPKPKSRFPSIVVDS